MSKNCITVYLTSKGEMSADYYGNLHLGHEQAEAIYLEKNKANLAKFQKKSSNKTIEEAISDWANIPKNPGLDTVSPSSVAKGYASDFNSEEFAKLSVIYSKAKSLLFENYKDYNYDSNPFFNDRGEEKKINVADKDSEAYAAYIDAENYYEKNPTELKQASDILQKMWDNQNSEGTFIHKLAEIYSSNYMNVEADESGKFNFLIDKLIEETFKTVATDVAHQFKLENYKPFLKSFHKMLIKIGNPGDIKVFNEVSMNDFATNAEGKEVNLRGTADMIIQDKSGKVYIYDFKTKARGKVEMFSYRGKRMKGLLSNLYDNRKVDAELQTTTYAMLAERAGLNIAEAKVLYVEGDLEYDKVQRQWFYKNTDLSHEIKLDYHRSELIKLFPSLLTPKERIEGKDNDVNEIIKSITGYDFATTHKIDKRISSELDKVRFDEKSGKEYFNNHITGEREFYKSKDVARRREQLKEYYEKESVITGQVSNDVIEYFNSGKVKYKGVKNTGNFDVYQIQANALLRGVEPENYTLRKVKDYPGFEHIDPSVLVAINKTNGDARIITISPIMKSKVEIEGANKNTNVFGKFISDLSLKLRNDNYKPLESNDENIKVLRNSILALELKDSGYIKTIDSLMVGIVNGYINRNESVRVTSVGMQEMLPHLELMRDLTKVKENFSPDMIKLFENKNLLDYRSYSRDYLEELRDQIQTGFNILPKNDRDSLFKDLNEYNNEASKRAELIKTLSRTLTLMGNKLSSKEDKKVNILLDKEYILLASTILQLNNVHYSLGALSQEMDTTLAKVKTVSKIGNFAMQLLSSRQDTSKQKFNQRMADFKQDFDKAQKALQEYHSKTAVSLAMSVDSAEMYKNLYRADPDNLNADFINSNATQLFTFKDPEDKSNGLSEVERNYIRVCNKWIQKGFSMAMSEDGYKKVEKQETWKTGMIPVMTATSANKIGREDDIKEKGKLILKSSFSNKKNMDETFSALNAEIQNKFLSQLGEGKTQNNETRRRLLGIDADGTQTNTDTILETNIEVIMYNFMQDCALQDTYQDVVGLYNAVNTISFIEQQHHFKDNENIRTFLGEYFKLIVFQEYKKEKMAHIADAGGNFFRKANFAGNLLFSASEITQGMLATFSSSLTQSILKDGRYNMKDLAKAAAMMTGDNISREEHTKVNALIMHLGIYESDVQSWTKKEKMLSRKNSWMQSKWLNYLSAKSFKDCKTTMILAQLINKGCLDAISVDSNGKLNYDVTKDARFDGIFDSKGELKPIDSLSTELKKKSALYNSMMEEWTVDGFIDENGKPTRPVTSSELRSMQDYSLSVYGSMDDNAKLVWQNSAFGRMFLTARSWVPVKLANYYTHRHTSEHRMKRVWKEDADLPYGGEYVLEGEQIEGIIQTLYHLGLVTKNIISGKEKGFEDISKNGYQNLTPNQKENLMRLGVDIAILGMITAVLMMAIDDDDERYKHGMGKALLARLNNATTDLNILSITTGLVDSNPIAMLSYANNTLHNIYTSVCYMASGDISKGSDYIFKNTGVGRFGVAIKEQYHFGAKAIEEQIK